MDDYGRTFKGVAGGVLGCVYGTAGTCGTGSAQSLVVDWNNGDTQLVTVRGTAGSLGVLGTSGSTGKVYRLILKQGTDGTSRCLWRGGSGTMGTLTWMGGATTSSLSLTSGQIDVVTMLFIEGAYYSDLRNA